MDRAVTTNDWTARGLRIGHILQYLGWIEIEGNRFPVSCALVLPFSQDRNGISSDPPNVGLGAHGGQPHFWRAMENGHGQLDISTGGA